MEVRGSLDIAGLERLAADPTVNNFTGRLYWNTSSEVLRLFSGGVWNTVGSIGQASGTVKYELQINSDLDLTGITADVIKYGYLMYPTTSGNDVPRTITTPAVASGELDQVALELTSYYYSTITVQTPDGKLFRNQNGTTSATLAILSNEHYHIFYDPDLGAGEWVVTETSEDDEAKINQVKRISANIDLTDFYITNQKTNSTTRFEIPISIVNESLANGTTITFFDGTTEDSFVENKRIWVHNPTIYTLDLAAYTAQNIRNKFTGIDQATWTIAAGSYAVLIHNTDIDQYEIVESDDPLIAPPPYALGDLKDVSVASPEDGQALVYNDGTGDWVAGASGDASFKLQSISGQDLTIKAGSLIMDSGSEFRTASGNDLTKDLTALSDDSYYFYIDMSLLAAPATVSGRELYDITDAMIVGLPTDPVVENKARYVPIGGATKTAGVWSDLFSTAFRRHDASISDQQYVKNSNFNEKGTKGWTKSAGTGLSIDRSTPLQGTGSLTWTNDGGLVEGELRTVDEGFQGYVAQGSARFRVVGTGGTYNLYLTDDGTKIEATDVTVDLTGGGSVPIDMFGFVLDDSVHKWVIDGSSADAADVCTIDAVEVTTKGAGQLPAGAKQYDIGPSGLNKVTVTNTTNPVVVRAVATPYKDQSGVWRMVGNIRVTHNADDAYTIAIDGITFESTPNNQQAVTVKPAASTTIGQARCDQGGNTINTGFSTSTGNTSVAYAFDVELESKPTWADDIPLVALSKGAVTQLYKFSATDSPTLSNGGTITVSFDTQVGDTLDSNTTLTIPDTNRYSINFNGRMTNITQVFLYREPAAGGGFSVLRDGIANDNRFALNTEEDLEKGDKLYLRIVTTTAGQPLGIETWTVSALNKDTGHLATGAGVANDKQYGLVLADKSQEKTLGGAVAGANTDILTFNNLIIGKRYLLKGVLSVLSGSNQNANFDVCDGTNARLKGFTTFVSNESVTASVTVEYEFTAANSTIKTRTAPSFGAGSSVNPTTAGINSSWLRITEINNTVETTDFT
jgi:hypothetical protein